MRVTNEHSLLAPSDMVCSWRCYLCLENEKNQLFISLYKNIYMFYFYYSKMYQIIDIYNNSQTYQKPFKATKKKKKNGGKNANGLTSVSVRILANAVRT